jgi:hypothetical protein
MADVMLLGEVRGLESYEEEDADIELSSCEEEGLEGAAVMQALFGDSSSEEDGDHSEVDRDLSLVPGPQLASSGTARFAGIQHHSAGAPTTMQPLPPPDQAGAAVVDAGSKEPTLLIRAGRLDVPTKVRRSG